MLILDHAETARWKHPEMNLVDLADLANKESGESVNMYHGQGNVSFLTDSSVLAQRLLAWFNEGDKHTCPRSLKDLPPEVMTTILSDYLHDNDHLADMCHAFPAEVRAEELEEGGTLDGVYGQEDEADAPFGDVTELELAEQQMLDEMPLPGFPKDEAERRRKWAAIPRQARAAIRRVHAMTGHKPRDVLVQILKSARAAPE